MLQPYVIVRRRLEIGLGVGRTDGNSASIYLKIFILAVQ